MRPIATQPVNRSLLCELKVGTDFLFQVVFKVGCLIKEALARSKHLIGIDILHCRFIKVIPTSLATGSGIRTFEVVVILHNRRTKVINNLDYGATIIEICRGISRLLWDDGLNVIGVIHTTNGDERRTPLAITRNIIRNVLIADSVRNWVEG